MKKKIRWKWVEMELSGPEMDFIKINSPVIQYTRKFQVSLSGKAKVDITSSIDS
nr:hypothetical protein [Tanacetum cinerariifolium]